MMLTLNVLTYRNQPTPYALAGRFSDAGGALGRGPDNLLVLDDPGKYISRTHARVSCRDGTYFLEDVGSNPSVVNDRPLGKGREIMLADGDRIVIGDYQLEARVVAAAPALPWLPPAPLNDPALPLFEPPPVAAPVPQPALESPSVVAAPAYQGAPFDALAGARILDVAPADGGALAIDDPLGLNLFAAPPPTPVVPGDFGLNLATQYRAAESDHVSPELVPFRMPAADTPKPAASGFAIPHDYDPLADFLPPVLAPAPTPPEPAAPPPSPESEPVAVRAELIQPVTTPQASAAIAPATKPASSPAASDSEILQALLRGLGLPDLQLNRSGVQVAETVGAMLREATTGTMDVLMARALTKKESRIDMTMISVSANNPLKFFPNPDSALTQMLTNTMAGYMPPVQAIRGAYDDLKAHELAVIAGMRAALAAVLQRFDPARIESRLAAPSVMDKMLAAHRKAKLWDRLVVLYGEIAREADDDLQRLYGEKFSEAYEEQVARLRQARK
ncbi:type VI secretion system-associated FHA domain protein TagH [Oxalobacteraceae bacterium OTU3CINTB1]|nr:type VI secretion system-associated FHA domain protein TagH [Oxalobacteraceae bacterium OTU3CINTB1]